MQKNHSLDYLDDTKIYNKYTHSYVDREEFKKAIAKDTTNPNNPEHSQKKVTTVLSVK